MGLDTLKNFVIALVIISMISAVLSLFIGNVNTHYSTNVTNMSYGFESYNKMNELNNITRDLQNNISLISEPTGVLDKIGGLFSSGYNSVLIIPKSFDVFSTMIGDSLKDTVLGEYGDPIKTAILIIVLIVIFIGGVLTILVKS